MSQPTRIVCTLVDARDDESCVRCGISLQRTHGSRHHRQLRRHGDHSAANLVLLCGSGTTGCHGWAHANPNAARDVGLIVASWHAAKDVPLYLEHLRRWALHNENGERTMITPDQAAERLHALSIR